MGGYEVRTHPDLISILYDLVAESGVKKGYAYGSTGGIRFRSLQRGQGDHGKGDGCRFPTDGVAGKNPQGIQARTG
jgi:hypothetical protein